MRTYRGYRNAEGHSRRPDTADEAMVIVIESTGQIDRLPMSIVAKRRSPSGFNWGYGGSGPAALAHSLVAHAVGVEAANRIAHRFLTEVVALLPQDREWSMTDEQIRAMVQPWIEIGAEE